MTKKEKIARLRFLVRFIKRETLQVPYELLTGIFKTNVDDAIKEAEELIKELYPDQL